MFDLQSSTTPPLHFNDAKMAGFGLRATSSLLWGGRELIVPFYSVQDSILDKMNGTFRPPLPPHFNDAKMVGFVLRAPSSLLWGGRGLIVPFYSVQDSILDKMNGTFRPPLPPISMMLKWRVLVFALLHHCFGGEGG